LGPPRAGVVETVFRRWDEIVGPALASHCRPLSVSDDTLVVAVDDPAHGSELRYLAEDLLAAIEDLTGTRPASRLVVRVRPPGPRRHDARW
jgi:predicted nucleic acid-binding Zn ribbon protein